MGRFFATPTPPLQPKAKRSLVEDENFQIVQRVLVWTEREGVVNRESYTVDGVEVVKEDIVYSNPDGAQAEKDSLIWFP